jgi:hypothetical protein
LVLNTDKKKLFPDNALHTFLLEKTKPAEKGGANFAALANAFIPPSLAIS